MASGILTTYKFSDKQSDNQIEVSVSFRQATSSSGIVNLQARLSFSYTVYARTYTCAIRIGSGTSGSSVYNYLNTSFEWTRSGTSYTSEWLTLSGSITNTNSIDLYVQVQPNSEKENLNSGKITISGIKKAYTLTVSAGTGSAITVSRQSSNVASSGTLSNGAVIYDGDSLRITASANANYGITSLKVNGANFTSGSTHTVSRAVTVSSTAQLQASEIGATDANIGANSTITITKYNSSYYHEITVSFEGFGRRPGETFGDYYYITKSGELTTTPTRYRDTSVSFRVPDSFYGYIPNSKTGTCYLACWTYSSSTSTTHVGTSKQCSFVVTATGRPTVGGTVVDNNASIISLTGDQNTLVRYKSTAKCTISATPTIGASITSKTINGQTPVNNVVTISGEDLVDSSFVFYAKDSRGYTRTNTITPTFIPYVQFTSNPVFYRPSPTTGRISLTFSGNFFNGSFGAKTNELALGYRYRLSTDAEFGSWVRIPDSQITISGNTYKSTSAIPISTYAGSATGFDYRNSYVFEFWAGDGYVPWENHNDDRVVLTQITTVVTVNEGVPVFDWGKNDFCFNVPVYLGDSTKRVRALGYFDDSSARGDITIGTGNYAVVNPPENMLPSGGRIIAISIITWTSNSGGFSIIPYGTNSTYAYILGDSGVVIKGLRLRWWYAAT